MSISATVVAATHLVPRHLSSFLTQGSPTATRLWPVKNWTAGCELGQASKPVSEALSVLTAAPHSLELLPALHLLSDQ